MPSRRVHRKISRLVLGRSFNNVHRKINGPYLYLGKKHRSLFHDPFSAVVIGLITSKDVKGALAGLLHTLFDDLCTRSKLARDILELSSNLDARENRLQLMKLLHSLTKRKMKR